MPRNPQEYGLNDADREYELQRKFGDSCASIALKWLSAVTDPTEQILGAVIFLARMGHPEDLDELVALANQDRDALLRAATVKDERG